MQQVKLALVGDGGVGKSALAIQFVTGVYHEDYDPTIEDTYRKWTTVDGAEAMIELLDGAGREDYMVLLDHYIKWADGFLLVFSLASRASFDFADKIFAKVLQVKNRDAVPMLLVGNKCDLADDARQLSRTQADTYAAAHQLPYLETSAKQRVNVDQAFADIVRIVRKDPLWQAQPLTRQRRTTKCLLL